MGLTIETTGRRVYVLGDTYAIRDRLREVGCRWDPQRRAWWGGTAKREAIEALAAHVLAGDGGPQRDEAPGLDATVAGRAEYKGRTYYVAGRVARGRTHYDDHVEPITSRDGARVLLYSRDGQRQFWARLWAGPVGDVIRVHDREQWSAPPDQAQIVKSYQRPTTIQRLRDYAAQRQAEQRGEAECPVCQRNCTCGTGRYCHHHHDGCDRCGAEG